MISKEKPLYRQIAEDYASFGKDAIHPLRNIVRREGNLDGIMERNVRIVGVNVAATVGVAAGDMAAKISPHTTLDVVIGAATYLILHKTALKKTYRELRE